MATRSTIEWTECTWNPVVGCSVVSPGCTHCYAMRMAARLEAIPEKRRALDIWAEHLNGIVGPKPTGNVVKLRG